MRKSVALFFFVLISGFCLSQSNAVKHLEQLKRKSTVSGPEIDSALTSCNLIKSSSPDSAIMYLRWLCISAEQAKFKQGTIGIYRLIGLSKRIQGEYDSALFYLRKAENAFGDSEFSKEKAEVYNAIAITYESKDDYSNSIKYQVKALEIFEKNNIKPGMADSYGNLGILYLNQNLFDESLKNQEKALEVFKSINSIDGQINTNSNIAIVYANKGDLKLALKYFLVAERLAENSGNLFSSASIYTNIGLIYYDLKNPELSLKYQNRALEIFKQLSDDQGISVTLLNMADILSKEGKINEAINLFSESVQICLKAGIKDNLISSYSGLAKCYGLKGNYKEEAGYLRKLSAVKDSVLNNDNRKTIRDIETKYQSEKKELEINNLNIQKKAQEAEISKRNSVLFLIFVIAVVLLIFGIFSYKAYGRKKKDNELISRQKVAVEEQKHLVEEKQKEILDSINYALQIQKTLLANHDLVNQTVPDSFVMFKPKDIVSGDFYWATNKDGKFFLAVCDSTGHGVPGAFMSLLNISFLNEAINEKNILQPNEVFNHVRKRLIESISQSGRQDGMDGVLICIDSKKISYASANNPPVLISKGAVVDLPYDKMPIGKGEKTEGFQLFEINYEKGDMLHLFTDGYADQFGGDKGKKFKTKKLNNLMLDISNKPVNEQKEIIASEFDNWKGGLEQVDDVTVLGIRL